MLPTKTRCPRCGRVLPAEAFNLVRGGRELAGWCRACNHRYYLDRKDSAADTRLRLVLRIDLNMMMKMMIGNKLQGALDQIAEGIARAMNAAPQV